MEKQLIFKEKYWHTLRHAAANGNSVDYYKSVEFVYDKKQILMIPNVSKPDLLKNLDEKNDFYSAIQIYEAFRDLEPIQAADERLWTYLTHVDLYPYVIKRWNNVYNNKSDNPSGYILEHWFFDKGILRNAISGFWWLVYLSVDENRNDKYELTKILFRQLDFATRTLGLYKLVRHKEAVIGILEFIQENEQLFKNSFENKTRFITKHLNLLGGTKPLPYFNRIFFKTELEKVAAQISIV